MRYLVVLLLAGCTTGGVYPTDYGMKYGASQAQIEACRKAGMNVYHELATSDFATWHGGFAYRKCIHVVTGTQNPQPVNHGRHTALVDREISLVR